LKKSLTQSGHIIYHCTAEETGALDGNGTCGMCGRQVERGYLVPILHNYVCQSCFDLWQRSAKWRPTDYRLEQRVAAHYESKIQVEGR
jgi:hypothetical protein